MTVVLTIRKDDERSLVDQIVMGVVRQIRDRRLPDGSKMPSIREFAKMHNVSRFTVVEAYDRLVAMGHLRSRRGDGFYATSTDDPWQHVAGPERKHNDELVWLIRRLLEAGDGTILAGGPWLPNAWLDEAGIRRKLGALTRTSGAHFVEYGNPFGYQPLREHLARSLRDDLNIGASPSQILLTDGTSRALELVIRLLLAPGDAALVDDPGYYNLFGNLRLSNVRMLAIPRTANGPDVSTLETLAAEHRPKIYFTQSAMQNPTGTNTSPHVAFKILQLAERYGFHVVEDDIFCDLQTRRTPRLAELDQLNRVVYARSFSKTLSGSLRVGFLACSQQLANELADVKMLTSITSSQVTERLIHEILVDGHYRKYVARVRERLAEARATVVRSFERIGLRMLVEPTDGMFVWARFPHVDDSMPIAERALREGIVVAPGHVFRPHLDRSPWMRFNVTACTEPRVERWLERAASSG